MSRSGFMLGEIIAIGDELTSGRVLNSTSRFAAAQLFASGHEIIAMTTIGDDGELIGRTLRLALERADFVVLTGGLGPTSDDLTNAAVATALDRPSTLYPEILRKIEVHARHLPGERRLAMEKLAWLPMGAHALHTEAKCAGYFLVQAGKPVFLLPGVPEEMEELLIETVITRLAVWEGEEVRQVRQKLFRITGLAESEVNHGLAHLEGRDSRLRIGYYPVFPEVHVSLTVNAPTSLEAEAVMAEYSARIKDILGEYCYTDGADPLEAVVGRLLGDSGLTVALAESCTGGLIAHRLTRVPGSSGHFIGGVVAYSNVLKENLLKVNPEIIARYGAVSGECAGEMAKGMRTLAGADLALAVSGIAGPEGGSEDKPVGTVWFALADQTGAATSLFCFAGDRHQVQAQAAQTGLDLLRRYLLAG